MASTLVVGSGANIAPSVANGAASAEREAELAAVPDEGIGPLPHGCTRPARPVLSHAFVAGSAEKGPATAVGTCSGLWRVLAGDRSSYSSVVSQNNSMAARREASIPSLRRWYVFG